MSQIYAALNLEHRLRQLELRIPRVGAWQADVVTDDAIPPSILVDGCSLSVGELTVRGAIVRAEPWQGTTRARIVGGNGGWQKYRAPRYYSVPTGVRRSVVLSDIASEVGEAMVAGLPDAIMSPWYVRPAGPASWVFQHMGLPWRILDNGETTFQAYPSEPVGATFVPMSYDAHRGVVSVATEAVERWRPNVTFSAPQLPRSFTADSVVHRMTSGTIRTEIWVR